MRSSFLPSTAIILLFLLATGGCAPGERESKAYLTETGLVSEPIHGPFEFTRVRMGTTVRILIHAEGYETARVAALAAFKRIDTLEMILSDYLPGSEIRTLKQAPVGVPIQISSDLARILVRSNELSSRTYGAFDVTCGPLTQLWRSSFVEGHPPAEQDVDAAVARVGWPFIGVDEDRLLLTLDLPGMAFDFGAIGKGWVADAMLEELAALGCPCSLVELGGDLAVGSPPPGRTGWPVGIALDAGAVARQVEVADCGLATSGDAEQHLEHEGVRYSHILDPRTGWPLTRSFAVTVQAPDAATADALASAISVLGPVTGPRLVSNWAGVHILASNAPAN